ncbi:hypothetical protein [Photobacterium phosphoreum]|uniref:hypothetical protein n=1 Tax=Photobacterium phosphoreum TaxID=659 RepID=UPI0005D35880|nr:hypothetical protein [Photobacterium phosphoreum]KJF87593.1 lactate dehydrogenase [Photobacterium phosphoreum]PQJ86298.1 lactate dehydrogenase [Photobacterium phosphoreum]PSV73091.1 lactate dehydrogenase [Photobacterium phosphoreum]
MTLSSTLTTLDQLPPACDNIQFNYCKTVACVNFSRTDPQLYVLQNSNLQRPVLICRECGAFPPVLSNHDVIAEKQRLTLEQNSGLAACSNDTCPHNGFPVLTYRQFYHAFGFSGERQRYRCKACQHTFVDPWSNSNNKHQLQQKLLAYLFTGHTVREICRRLAMNPKTFYDQLNNIAARCRRQLTIFDARLGKQSHSHHLATDFTPLQPNSNNGVLWIATAEADSGYVISQHVNYQTQAAASYVDHHDAYQVDTRFIAPHSYHHPHDQPTTSQGLLAHIDATYRQILARKNMENPLSGEVTINYPTKGCLIRPQYTVYGHFLYLRKLLNPSIASFAVFMPQETLLRSACLSVFIDRINNHTIDPLYVVEDNSWQHGQQVEKIDIVLMGWWRDRWAFSRNNSSNKGICHLGGNKKQQQHWLTIATHQAATVYQQRFHDQFSHMVNEPRRKLRPASLLPLLDIYRAWHNLCHQNKAGVTPAQALGLMSSPMTLEQLLQ